MKSRFSSLILCCLTFLGLAAQPQPEAYPYDLSYFLPEGYTYNPEIPTPEKVLGFQLGQQHADYGQVALYMQTLAAASDRVSVKEMGRTYQHRPFLEVIFTSPANQRNLEQIKEQHFKLSEPSESGSLDIKNMPVVTSIIYSIHGNEPSGVNAGIAISYFLAAAQGPEIDKILENSVVVFTPAANPDGVNRFASWVNSSRSLTDVTDLNSREFTEPWPSSRTNHYWADCNRDWLMLQHPEGRNGVATFFDWLPNIVLDEHEQGSARPYYMSPGHPKRTHYLTSQLNQDITAAVSGYAMRELDKIGTGYYSKEGYDDYYYGKGAAYGDIHGAICLLYEQGTSRGHKRMTVNGVRSFAWTIRNQALGAYGTIVAGYELKDKLLEYQRDFFKKQAADLKKEAVKGYVLDSRGSDSFEYHFLENMKGHHLDVYRLAKDVTVNGKKFKKDQSLVVPVDQKYGTMVRAVMEDFTEFDDSTFYDISAWTFPYAFNLQHAPVQSTAGLLGDKITDVTFKPGKVIGGKSDYGYMFDTREFYVYKIIYELQKKGVYVNVGGRPSTFRSGDVEQPFGYGVVQVMAQNQPISSDEIYDIISRYAAESGVDVYAATAGVMPDVDIASPSYIPVHEPKVAVLTGRTMGVPDCGEVWYLLDKRFGMQPVMMETNALTGKKLAPYNVIVLPNGEPAFNSSSTEALKAWVANGGTLIATGKSCDWVIDNGLAKVKTKSTALKNDSSAYLPYEMKRESTGNAISGVIMNCHIDKTHPLGWGLDQDEIQFMKKGTVVFAKDADPYSSPIHYTKKPRLSGFISDKNAKLISDTPAVIVKPYKSGNVILFADDPNFRSYWFGGSKVFMNAVFFNECIK